MTGMGRAPSVVGVGMTSMARRDRSPEEMVHQAVQLALGDAGLGAGEIGLVVMANAMGGRLSDQGCIRGQTWLRAPVWVPPVS